MAHPQIRMQGHNGHVTLFFGKMAEQNSKILESDGKHGCITRDHVHGICIYPQGSMAIAKICCHLAVSKGTKDVRSTADIFDDLTIYILM